MGINSLLILSILIFNYSCFARSKKICEEYKKTLDEIIIKIKNGGKIEVNDILESMPGSNKEAIIFYSYDYSTSTSKSFQFLNEKINENSLSNNEVLSKYLAMSQFVDGYFAESYFDVVESIAQKNNVNFCNEYQKLRSDKVSRLADIVDKWCK